MSVSVIKNPTSESVDAAVNKPTGSGWIAHKFGGSSLANAERIRTVADIMRGRTDAGQVIVVSAMQGVTDALIELAHAAARNDGYWRHAWNALKKRHEDAARALLGAQARSEQDWLAERFAELADLLHALALLGSPAAEALELIQGLGEIFSSRILAAHLNANGIEYALLDARDVLVVRHEDLGVAVDWDQSATKLAEWRVRHPQMRVVVSGFVARDVHNRITTLGRNGSDYSGAIFGALFHADEIHIWTDVDGVLSADPRLVPEAVLLPQLSYHEACELAYFGAKVIHPQTMAPAIARNIPVYIRNTFRPELSGTCLSSQASIDSAVKGISTIPGLAIVNIEGAGMIGVPGTAQRVFGALRAAKVSVVMISQGSSEHSICCVVQEKQVDIAMHALDEEFIHELARGQLQSINATPSISVLAIVGDGMTGTPGVAARLFGTLARSGVNIRAIAQGASERNISVAIESGDAARALRAAHAGFYLSPQTISIGVVGPGQVGRAFLAQLAQVREHLLRTANLDLRLRAVASSASMLLDDASIPPQDWRERLDAHGTATDLTRFADHVLANHLPHAAIIDCSASGDVAEHYARWIGAGIHVVTPNKHAGSGPLARYKAIRAASSHGTRFRYEATVGAGLPIVQTLRDLLDTGDEIISIEGIFSGTLAYLFNRYDGSVPFSTLVQEARAAGYTEPDPRDDLNGRDVARKLVILAREMGLQMEVADVDVESLVPVELREVDGTEFLERLVEADESFAARFASAHAAGKKLRYVARLNAAGQAHVGLVELPSDHAFAHLRLTDNIVQFTTRRYRDNPLVVQGPGAGPEVTAAGVFADLLRIAATLGARV